DTQLDRILDIIGSSWALSTKEMYGAGLLVFHVFCNTNSITEDKRCPVTPTILLTFLSSCAGSYLDLALANYVAGLRAWHLLHSRPWLVSPNELKAMLEGVKAITPTSSKQLKCLSFMPHALSSIHDHLDLKQLLDAAVYACLTTTFYCIARLGKFTVKTVKSYNPTKYIARRGVSETTDRHGHLVMKFKIPSMKSAPLTGEDMLWAEKEGLFDPKEALLNHFHINPTNDNTHLFVWKHPKGLRPLLKKEVLKWISPIAAHANLPELKGHRLCIGSTLEYLLGGIPFKVVKSIGRWSSDAFTLYLRDHVIILAPYIQASPVLKPFMCYTLPPVC
ncbi:hypothetical protein BDR06DRAFT_895000, partial [Suillus hirtellus]